VKAAPRSGLYPHYLELPGGTHLTIVALVGCRSLRFLRPASAQSSAVLGGQDIEAAQSALIHFLELFL